MSKIISFIQSKGGVGKSTLLCSLATVLKEDNKKIALIDTDKQNTTCEFGKEFGFDYLTSYEIEDFKSIISDIKKQYEIILIDTAGFDNVLVSEIIKYTDIHIIPITASQPDINGFLNTYDNIKKFSHKKSITKIILNRYEKTKINEWILENLKDYSNLIFKVSKSTAFSELHTIGTLKRKSKENIINLKLELEI